MQLFALALMLSHHSLSLKVLTDFGMSLPALAAGTAAGIVLFGRINEAAFKRIILGLLLFRVKSGQPRRMLASRDKDPRQRASSVRPGGHVYSRSPLGVRLQA